MTNTQFDIVIVGGGPIGSSTAYFLSQNKSLKIALVTKDDFESSTFKSAGGSIRWYWDDQVKTEMTKQTADFIKELIGKGIDLGHLEDTYLFLNRGVHVPSLNIGSAKLINYFQKEFTNAGGVLINSEVKSVDKADDGFKIITTDGELTSKKVLVAAGPNTDKLVPDFKLEYEKRQLFVLDLPVDENRKTFPHTIIPINDGVAYVFIKIIEGEYKMLVGQEDVVEDDEQGPNDYYSELLKAGLSDRMPFLANTKPDKILFGYDADNKTLEVHQEGNLFAAACGSAIRGCVYIGKTLADKIKQQ
jgi:glycine/D-amino acid oxidase-like deaminating enzyme